MSQFYLVAISDTFLLTDRPLTDTERNKYKKLCWEAYCKNPGAYPVFNREASVVLNKELPKDIYKGRSGRFHNYLNEDRGVDIQPFSDNYQIFKSNFMLLDEDIKQGWKEMGITIKRETDIRLLRYDPNKQGYILLDRGGHQCEPLSYCGYCTCSDSDIVVADMIFGIEKKDMRCLDELFVRKNQLSNDYFQKSLSPKEKALFSAYEMVQDRTNSDRMLSTLKHELDHARRNFGSNKLNIAQDRGCMNLEDILRLQEYDEKAAKFRQCLDCVNKYLAQPDPNDLTMFENVYGDCVVYYLYSALKKLSPLERRQKVLDNEWLVKGAFKSWDRQFRQVYHSRQFINNLRAEAQCIPLCFYGNDVNKTEYKKRRSMALTMAKYNPVTRKTEWIDFSQFISSIGEIPITDTMRNTIIQPAENIVTQRKQNLMNLGISMEEIEGVLNQYRANYLGQQIKPTQKQQTNTTPQTQDDDFKKYRDMRLMKGIEFNYDETGISIPCGRLFSTCLHLTESMQCYRRDPNYPLRISGLKKDRTPTFDLIMEKVNGKQCITFVTYGSSKKVYSNNPKAPSGTPILSSEQMKHIKKYVTDNIIRQIYADYILENMAVAVTEGNLVHKISQTSQGITIKSYKNRQNFDDDKPFTGIYKTINHSNYMVYEGKKNNPGWRSGCSDKSKIRFRILYHNAREIAMQGYEKYKKNVSYMPKNQRHSISQG